MSEKLPAPDFDSLNYARPNQNWMCGHACEGKPCRPGPDNKGRCQATFDETRRDQGPLALRTTRWRVRIRPASRWDMLPAHSEMFTRSDSAQAARATYLGGRSRNSRAATDSAGRFVAR